MLHRVGMTHFATNPSGIWGETLVTARDLTYFFHHIDRYIVSSHRRYAMRLLASIIPSERWGIAQVAPGIAQVAPRGWKLYFKGGWG